MLNIEKRIENGSALYLLEGRLDTNSAAGLEKDLKETLTGLTELTLDLEKLDYISSAGLRLLLSARKTMDGRGPMKLVHVGEAVMTILETAGFLSYLNIEKLQDEDP